MDTINSLLAVILVVNFGLALLILFHGKNEVVKKLYSAMIFVVFAWTLSMMLYRVSGPEYQVVWCRVLYFAASFTSTTFLFFSLSFPDGKIGISKRFIWAILAWNFLYGAFILFDDSTVRDVIIRQDQEKLIVWGSKYWLYPIHTLGFFLWAYYHLYFLKLRKLHGILRQQASWVFWGFFISGNIAFLTNLSMPSFGYTSLNWFGQIASTVMLATTAYAILKLHLLNIRLLLAESITYIILVIIILELFFSKSSFEVLLRILFLLFMIFGGKTLIKSINKEIEQKKMLERDKEELMQLDRMKDEFLHMATHELNTPITSIKGRLDMAINENFCKLDKEQRAFLEPVLYDTVRLAHLSKDILDTARIDQKRMPLNIDTDNLDQLISEAVNSLQVQAGDKGNMLEYLKSDIPIPTLKFDRSKIGEVITNLINNANKFTNKGKITVKTKLEVDYVVVSVADTGIGISEEDQKHLFEKFYQVGRFHPQNPTEQQGSGLGLYISRNIISLHGGKFWLESKLDQGTTFYFSLPLEYKEVEHREATSIFDHSQNNRELGKGAHVS